MKPEQFLNIYIDKLINTCNRNYEKLGYFYRLFFDGQGLK